MFDRLEIFDSVILPMQRDTWCTLPLQERIKTIDKVATFYEYFHDKMGVIDGSLPAFVMFHGFMKRMRIDETVRESDELWRAIVERYRTMDELERSLYIQETVALYCSSNTILHAEMFHQNPLPGLLNYMEGVHVFSETILNAIYFEV